MFAACQALSSLLKVHPALSSLPGYSFLERQDNLQAQKHEVLFTFCFHSFRLHLISDSAKTRICGGESSKPTFW